MKNIIFILLSLLLISCSDLTKEEKDIVDDLLESLDDNPENWIIKKNLYQNDPGFYNKFDPGIKIVAENYGYSSIREGIIFIDSLCIEIDDDPVFDDNRIDFIHETVEDKLDEI